MAKFIFSLGVIEKKSLLPLIYVISHICVNIYKNYAVNELFDTYIENLGICFGQLMTFFVGRLIKYRSKTHQKIKRPFLHYIKDYIILFIISSFYMLDLFTESEIQDIAKMSKEEKNDYSREIFFVYGIEILLITIVSYFWLRIRYYIHHLISIIIIIIVSVIIDILLDNFSHIHSSSAISIIINFFADSLIYPYAKYLMERKYYI